MLPPVSIRNRKLRWRILDAATRRRSLSGGDRPLRTLAVWPYGEVGPQAISLLTIGLLVLRLHDGFTELIHLGQCFFTLGSHSTPPTSERNTMRNLKARLRVKCRRAKFPQYALVRRSSEGSRWVHRHSRGAWRSYSCDSGDCPDEGGCRSDCRSSRGRR